MEWQESYSVGIVEIDDQHKGLLRAFTAIEEAIAKRKRWSDTHLEVIALKNLARNHFAFEEALMRLFGYPEGEAHRKEHAHFFTMIDSIELHSIKDTAEQEMIDFLRTWLTKHIMGTDRSYADFIFAGAQVVKMARPAKVSVAS